MVAVLLITFISLALLLLSSRKLELTYMVYFFCGTAIIFGNSYISNSISRMLYEGAVILLYLAFQLFVFFWRNQSDKS